MALHSLPARSLPSFRHDALIGGLGIAIRGLVLPGLPGPPGGPLADPHGEFPEAGPLDAEPVPLRAATTRDQPLVARPHVWRHLAASATTSLAPAIRTVITAREDAMFGEGHNDSIVQRGIDEALACQDMLQRAPVRPSRMARIVARLVALAPPRAQRKPAPGRRVIPTQPTSTISR